MLVKDKKTGEVIARSWSAAYDLVDAGTHEIVNERADPGLPPAGMGTLPGEPGRDDAPPAEGDPGTSPNLDAMTKAELEAEAERRGVEVPSGATKAEIAALLKG